MNSVEALFALALLVPDGVGVRNFVLEPFLGQATRRANLHIIQPVPLSSLGIQNRTTVSGYGLLPHQEHPVGAVLRSALTYGHLKWAGTRSMRHQLNRPINGSMRHKALHAVSRLLGNTVTSHRMLMALDQLYTAVARRQRTVAQYRALFEAMQPAVLLCTHQRPPVVVPAVLAARDLGIPTATFIFSWDNLSSKGRIAASFDHYLVWSNLMRSELLRYYPEVMPDQVHVVGTPQFDIYAEEDVIMSREDFFSGFGADPKRPLICYSGGDKRTCPEDPDHVRVLLRLIRDGAIKGRPQVLLRPAPVDDSRRYDEVKQEFSELIMARPDWVRNGGSWAQIIPTQADVIGLANLTYHADLNVNLASTMTLDFAIHDKPVVNIAFDVAEPPPKGVPIWDYYYQFEHYRPVVELGAARFARSAAELADHINTYLHTPSLDRQGRRKLVELEVGVPIGQSSTVIIDTLSRIVSA